MLGAFMKPFIATVTLVGVLVLVFLAGIYLVSALSMLQPPRPTDAPVVGYSLTYTTPDGVASDLQVDAEGRACARLAASELLQTACVLALNLDTVRIAGQAFGRLNTEDTPAFEAIKWRARLDANVEMCNKSGLLAPRLEECRSAVTTIVYEARDSGITVSILAGGAPASTGEG